MSIPTPEALFEIVDHLGALLQKRQWTLITAESCTGGALASLLTARAGSSLWFDRGLITYSNTSKQALLGVKTDTLKRFGAVSEETAREMVEGSLIKPRHEVALAITGLAGPGGGSPEKPVGTVCFAFAEPRQRTFSETRCFAGSRQSIREQSLAFALHTLLATLSTD